MPGWCGAIPQASGFLSVLRGVDFVLMPGEVVALVGPSGSGKSTLLHICGLLDRPDKGAVVLGGNDVSGLDDRTRTALRRIEVGFVYQFHHLLPEFSAMENVVMPQLISGRKKNRSPRPRPRSCWCGWGWPNG